MNRSRSTLAIVSTLVVMFAVALPAYAQEREGLPSPSASVSQLIGAGTVEITYHRPGVKGRDGAIWGDLVKYDKVWRAGANATTTISFEENVTINGEKLAAGKYGFLILVTKKEWTLIFSKVSEGGGNYEGEEQDALRVTVKPEKIEHKEWLDYGFEKLADTEDADKASAVAYIRWERRKASFKIQAD